MKYTYISLLFVAATTVFGSCTDKLDMLPDNRMTLKSPSDVSRLLVTAYPGTYPASILESYSDNTDELINPSWSAFSNFQEQSFNWEDVIDNGYGDDPTGIFDGFWGAVAAANKAIEHIEGVSNKNEYTQQLGEAYLCRAYAVFQLSTVFCEAYTPERADKALGMPYPTAPENTVGVHYDRGTIGQTYKKIEEDLLKGLALVGSNYAQPKYHFTPDAGNAFAARFYLYYQKYDKAIEYATKVLTANPENKLRNWTEWNKLSPNEQWQPDAYIDANAKCNLLLVSAYSAFGYYGGPGTAGARYAHGEVLANTETLRAKGPWGNSASLGYVTWSNTASSKVILRKIPFFYANSNGGGNGGAPYSTYSAFNTDETLMVRAEAYALSGQYDKALADLNTELKAFSKNPVTLTLQTIKDFYNSISYYTPTKPTPKKKFHTNFAIESSTQEPLLQAILQLKRLVTIHEGLRMQDVKRYGITIYRRSIETNNTINPATDSLTVNDPRVAIQIPQETIVAGLQANPRNKK